MKIIKDPLVPVLTGFAGGLLAWSGGELVLYLSPVFGNLRTLLLVLGAVTGFLLGAIVPLTEGLRQRNTYKIISSFFAGSLTGALFGAFGMVTGQLILTELLNNSSLAFSEPGRMVYFLLIVPGWAVLGGVIGASAGIRAMSLRRIFYGFLGGLTGGIIGGFFTAVFPDLINPYYGRLTGFLIWGIAVAVLSDLFDIKQSSGRLIILNGPDKGITYNINKNKMTLSDSKRADITISGETEDQTEAHSGYARVYVKKGTVFFEPENQNLVQINGHASETAKLRHHDVIRIGGTTLLYEAEN